MLFALLVSAFAAQGASAATKGTTVVTCKEGPGDVGSTWGDAHCKEVGTGFGHYAVGPETTTELDGSNITTGSERSVAKLHSVQAGVEEEFQAKVVKRGSGSTPWVKNLTTGKEHYIEGEGRLLYEEIEVTKPAGKGCKVEGGKVETKQLKAHTMGIATEEIPRLNEQMVIKFEPASGTTFAEFNVVECSVGSLNGPYTVTGSLKATPKGATLETTGAGVTGQGKLFVRGQKAGIDGAITINGRDPAASETLYTPLSVTTIETE
jgi:hypothetical protein